jgi:hypothetical protein
MLAQYGENPILQRKTYQWVVRFKIDKASVTDEDHLGHPTTSQMAENAEHVNALVQGMR